jgi:hypothetical protein
VLQQERRVALPIYRWFADIDNGRFVNCLIRNFPHQSGSAGSQKIKF